MVRIFLVGVLLVLLLGTSDSMYAGEREVPPPVAAPVRTLRILAPHDNPAGSQALLTLGEQYAAIPGNPDVDIRFITKNDFKKEICLNLDQAALDDLILCDNSVMPALINLGVLRDISGYVDQSRMVYQYALAQWNNTRSDGKYYGIPFTNDPYVLIFNQDLFKERNAVLPDTWEDWKQTARQIQKVGSFAIGIGARQPEEITALYLQLLYSTGGSIRDVNGQGGMKVLELLHFMKVNKMLSPQCVNWNQADLIAKFQKGEISMMVNQLSALAVLRKTPPDFAVGVMAVPYDKKENFMFHGKNLGVSVTADPDMAYAFLEYVTRRDVIEKVADTLCSIPVQLDLMGQQEPDVFVNREEFMRKLRAQGIAKSSLNSWFDISSAISEGVFSVVGQKDPVLPDIAETMHDKVRIAIIEN